ncbi:uroporphyrinogen-III synthase [Staphylococcus americanisciuri]|uniref:Uroporphyrinogen-III synthase n=1 Tax=Staphylococcus americanisciuri TaxID=2973940 RepID=A0ABT2F042_9STAP|nr:uroporphyrinogen-III synthase [Staphylococcus americanisciuri]MCS4485651.1 uroporphyrinogen-III synthase [Staphylococcus americanisciuri]
MKPTVIMTQTLAYHYDQINVCHIPLLSTVACPFDQKVLDNAYDWLIFSSQNAVAYFQQYLPNVRVKHIAAIGKKTAQFCEQQGIRVDFVPDDFSQEGFLAQFEAETNATILLPSSAQARPKLANELSQRGYSVTKVNLYDVEANKVAVNRVYEMLVTQQADAITFASSSAVCALFDRHPDIDFDALYVIGVPTQKTLSDYGYQGIVADKQTLDAMIDKILEKRF